MAVAIGIFAVALAAIATERIDRTRIAMLGALLMLLTQTVDQEQAIEAVDWGTLGLLAATLLAAALQVGVSRFVQVSTDEVYGELPWVDPASPAAAPPLTPPSMPPMPQLPPATRSMPPVPPPVTPKTGPIDGSRRHSITC